jgi:hypothetical protein
MNGTKGTKRDETSFSTRSRWDDGDVCPIGHVPSVPRPHPSRDVPDLREATLMTEPHESQRCYHVVSPPSHRPMTGASTMTRKPPTNRRPRKAGPQGEPPDSKRVKNPTVTTASAPVLRSDRGTFVSAKPPEPNTNIVLDEAAARVLDREANRRLWRRIRDNKKAPYAQRLKASEMLERDGEPPTPSHPRGAASAEGPALEAVSPEQAYMDMVRFGGGGNPTPSPAPTPDPAPCSSKSVKALLEKLGEQAQREQGIATGPLKVVDAAPPVAQPVTPIAPPEPVAPTPARVIDATPRPEPPPPQAPPPMDPEVARVAATLTVEGQTPEVSAAIRRRAEEIVRTRRATEQRIEEENRVAREQQRIRAEKMRDQGLEE